MTPVRSLGRSGVGAAVVLGLVSIGVAVCAAWISRAAWRPDPLVVPWGLVLGVAGALSVGLIARSGGQPHRAAAAGGWILGVVLWLSRPHEAVIAADAWGYAFLLLPTAAVLGMTLWAAAPT